MAAGRGEFFWSLWTGLQRQLPPGGRAAPPGRGRGKPGPERGAAGSRGGTRPPRAAWSSAPWSFGREREERNCLETREVYLHTLPPEVLLKVLSFLDASSLFCISHVCRLFHQLANEDDLWRQIYTSEFGTQTWRPKSAHDAGMKASRVEEVEERPPGHWKKMYFRTLAGREVNKWKRELRDIRPHTGLPRQTELVLRTLNVSWELTLCDLWGEVTLRENQVHFLQSSLVVRWSEGVFPSYHHISSLQVHGVRKETQKIPRVRPSWRSLILKLDLKTEPHSFIGRDKLIKLIHLSPGVLIGSWRGKNSVAFIMVSLHFHKLVEKSLLGSPACLYSEPVETSDPALNPQGYSVHFVLHSPGALILSETFSHVHCRRSVRDLLEMTLIDSSVLPQHKPLSGSIRLPWRSEELEGAVENCCVMTLTVLNGFLTPVWCVSTPVFIRMARKPPSAVYSGEHFLMHHDGPGGKVKMKLVWLKEQKQFFLISLIIYI